MVCLLWTVVHSPYAHQHDAVAAQAKRRENDRPAKEIRWGVVGRGQGGCLPGIVWMNLDRATGRGSFQDRTF